MDKIKLNVIEIEVCMKIAAELFKVRDDKTYDKLVDMAMDVLKAKKDQEGLCR